MRLDRFNQPPATSGDWGARHDLDVCSVGCLSQLTQSQRSYVDPVVTGAASGIGRALAERLAAKGYRVHLADVVATEELATSGWCAPSRRRDPTR